MANNDRIAQAFFDLGLLTETQFKLAYKVLANPTEDYAYSVREEREFPAIISALLRRVIYLEDKLAEEGIEE